MSLIEEIREQLRKKYPELNEAEIKALARYEQQKIYRAQYQKRQKETLRQAKAKIAAKEKYNQETCSENN